MELSSYVVWFILNKHPVSFTFKAASKQVIQCDKRQKCLPIRE